MRPMLAVAAGCACLFGCAAPAPAIHALPPATLARLLQPGVTTRAQAAAAAAPDRKVVFDSGYEAWLYHYAAPGGGAGEWVVLFGPDGVLRKARQRAPDPLPR